MAKNIIIVLLSIIALGSLMFGFVQIDENSHLKAQLQDAGETQQEIAKIRKRLYEDEEHQISQADNHKYYASSASVGYYQNINHDFIKQLKVKRGLLPDTIQAINLLIDYCDSIDDLTNLINKYTGGYIVGEAVWLGGYAKEKWVKGVFEKSRIKEELIFICDYMEKKMSPMVSTNFQNSIKASLHSGFDTEWKLFYYEQLNDIAVAHVAFDLQIVNHDILTKINEELDKQLLAQN